MLAKVGNIFIDHEISFVDFFFYQNVLGILVFFLLFVFVLLRGRIIFPTFKWKVPMHHHIQYNSGGPDVSSVVNWIFVLSFIALQHFWRHVS